MACDADTLRRIVNNPSLSSAKKARALSIEAENACPIRNLTPILRPHRKRWTRRSIP